MFLPYQFVYSEVRVQSVLSVVPNRPERETVNVLPPCSRIRFDNVRIHTLFLTDMHKQSCALFHVNTHNSAS